ncbi:peptidyl-prolyl cis-trans isomerase-like 4 [Gorgonomyces haynaldii]|nr:peptidyl-prolyl cis-trans isomerase-like 4 [Gorgonomyces haynaldii]
MSVLIETNLGEIVVDLLVTQCPKSSKKFIQLCKEKRYNYSFSYVEQDFVCDFEIQMNDIFAPENINRWRKGAVGFSTFQENGVYLSKGDFFLQLGASDSLGHHGLFGYVAEGMDVLEKINTTLVDDHNRPFEDIYILHTIVLDDPFDLQIDSMSPPPEEYIKGLRILDKEAPKDEDLMRQEMESRALTLEMVGDLPDADLKPPENVLFVCRLNPVTRDKDLKTIFSRFGEIVDCTIIRDKDTQESLGYAFIEFAEKEACEQAYSKMENVLIDDRRIHVDFSQSVSKQGHHVHAQKFDDYGKGLEKRTRYRHQDTKEEHQYVFEHDLSHRPSPYPPRRSESRRDDRRRDEHSRDDRNRRGDQRYGGRDDRRRDDRRHDRRDDKRHDRRGE